VFGFLGPNGAGKSTTIKILTGLISATSGSASVFGIPVSESESRIKVGYLPENPSYYDFLTAKEYLKFVGNAYGMEEDKIQSESERVLKLMGIYDASSRPIRGYSKGMVQRLGLAQALLHDPDLYILDEPMSGLDPLGRALVKDIIRDLKEKGKTVFFSTHITSDVEIVCDRVGIIVAGKLQKVDNVYNILQSGIEGYYVQVKKNISSAKEFGFSVTEKSPGIHEIFVPRAHLMDFMKKIIESGAEVDLIEPKRTDLESFLLEVVSKKST
jgi:ABC-2 type transport system ATP-binding protein